MGLHINKNLLKNANYKKSVENEFNAIRDFLTEAAENFGDHAQALYDLVSGKENITYYTAAGEEKVLSFKAIKFDKINRETFEKQAEDYVEDEDDDLIFGEEDEDKKEEREMEKMAQKRAAFGWAVQAGLGDIEKRMIDARKAFEGEVATEYDYMNSILPLGDIGKYYNDSFVYVEETKFEKEELEQNKAEIENNKFGFYGTSAIYAKSENLTLSDKIMKHLGARNPEDWLDCMPNQKAIDDCVRYYERSEGNVHLNDAQYAMGRLIVEGQDGKDIDENNIIPILNDVKAKSDEYKSVNWFRRALSYINPAKDAVRDMRNEINDAKEILKEKNVDMKQLDAFLDGKAKLEDVKVPEIGPYQMAMNGAMNSLRQVNGVVNSADYKEGLEHLKIYGAMLDKVVDHEFEIFNPAEVKEAGKWPLDEQVQKSMNEMEGPAESEKFVENGEPVREENRDRE